MLPALKMFGQMHTRDFALAVPLPSLAPYRGDGNPQALQPVQSPAAPLSAASRSQYAIPADGANQTWTQPKPAQAPATTPAALSQSPAPAPAPMLAYVPTLAPAPTPVSEQAPSFAPATQNQLKEVRGWKVGI
jgi:hypothetical protein